MTGRQCADERGNETAVRLPTEKSRAIMATMTKTLELAISRALRLPDAAQEQLGRELLERIDTLDKLRAEIELGAGELDAGLGETLDIETVILRARTAHGE